MGFFEQLAELFTLSVNDHYGFYEKYLQRLQGFLWTTKTTSTVVNDVETIVTERFRYDAWPVFVPWQYIIATVVLITFIVCIFKFMRTVLCKIL